MVIKCAELLTIVTTHLGETVFTHITLYSYNVLRKTQKSSYFLEDIELFRPLWTGRWTQRGHFLIPQHESLRVPNLFLLFSAFFSVVVGGGGVPIALPSKLVSFIFKVSSLMRFLSKRETKALEGLGKM